MILQKIKTGSSLFLDYATDKDFIVFYNSKNTNRNDLYNDLENYFLIDIKKIDEIKSKFKFFLIMTYILHIENNWEYEIIGTDYFKNFYNEYKNDFIQIKKDTVESYLRPYEGKLKWWFLGADNYIQNNHTGINKTFVENNRNRNQNPHILKEQEKNEILNWFTKTDYIELQAVRGIIDRNSEKYIIYINEYNRKLNRLREIKGEENV